MSVHRVGAVLNLVGPHLIVYLDDGGNVAADEAWPRHLGVRRDLPAGIANANIETICSVFSAGKNRKEGNKGYYETFHDTKVIQILS